MLSTSISFLVFEQKYMSILIEFLCMGRVHQPSEANSKWKEKIQYFQQSNKNAELSGIDGEQIEFE